MDSFDEYKDMPTVCPASQVNWSVTSQTPVTLPTQYKLRHFDSSDMHLLQMVYKALYPSKETRPCNQGELVPLALLLL